MAKPITDATRLFRSFNPTIHGNLLFSFKEEQFDFEIAPGINRCNLTNWTIDPLKTGNDDLIYNLFNQQLDFKNHHVGNNNSQIRKGDIFVAHLDGTVKDGASEVQSMGLIDSYDIPPIDTWFYLADSSVGRLLFAWIPMEFRHYANEAILVNCVGCIDWFKDAFPEDYDRIMNYKSKTH